MKVAIVSWLMGDISARRGEDRAASTHPATPTCTSPTSNSPVHTQEGHHNTGIEGHQHQGHTHALRQAHPLKRAPADTHTHTMQVRVLRRTGSVRGCEEYWRRSASAATIARPHHATPHVHVRAGEDNRQ